MRVVNYHHVSYSKEQKIREGHDHERVVACTLKPWISPRAVPATALPGMGRLLTDMVTAAGTNGGNRCAHDSWGHSGVLGHVQQSSPCCLRSGNFSENPSHTPADDRGVPSWEDDGGACSKAQTTPPTPLYPGHRRFSAAGGFAAASSSAREMVPDFFEFAPFPPHIPQSPILQSILTLNPTATRWGVRRGRRRRREICSR
jgi:hypothetical protein